MLQSWGTPPDLLPTLVTNESGQGKDRAVMYQKGGVFVVTSRILIVDLLTHVASPKDIDGMLVYHAERVNERSTEAFILRIYRTQKRWGRPASSNGNGDPSQSFGFVKAFTESPEVLSAGFGNVDKTLKSLQVRRLYLYPRFQASIADELERYPPAVDELRQELTPRMKEIQGAIAAAVQACIRELKKSTTLIEWSTPDLDLANCVTAHFDTAISRQLEHDWHRLRPSTKQLVNDLRTLRNLFQYLTQYDSVAFWRLLNGVKTMSAAARHPSMWLLTPAADLLFRKAKDRVYSIERPKPTSAVPEPIARLIPVLEENPKWRLLRQVLTEIRSDWSVRRTKRRRRRRNREGGSRALVMVKDERTLDTLRSYLVEGKERAMTRRWLNYLESSNDRARARTSGGSSVLSEESRLLLEEEGRARRVLFGTGAASSVDDDDGGGGGKRLRRRRLNAVPDRVRRRRRIAEERGRGQETLRKDDLRRRAVLDEALETTEIDMERAPDVEVVGERRLDDEDGDDDDRHDHDEDGGPSDSSSSDLEEELAYRVRPLDELRVELRTYSSAEGDGASLLLRDLRPEYVVLYDADPSFIRALEIYSNFAAGEEVDDEGDEDDGPAPTASPPSSAAGEAKPEPSKYDRMRVFFMLFEASAEEKNFLNLLDRERNAFERLIRHKKTMPLPVLALDAGSTQEMQLAGAGAVGSYASGTLPLSMDTRTGRGKKRVGKERRDVAVDVREFRSALPSVLHRGGMRLAPVTLTVGDFVLSAVHCVERKSVGDLFGSFASGRLYAQAEAMSKHYKCPCLLIEFDPGKSFGLQNSNEIGVEIRADAITSKMALLTMHFPRLRILWSRGPHETLKLFMALKTNHEEVDVDRAVEIGSNESADALPNAEGDADEINEAARDALLRLPGVNVNGARKIMQACDCLADLAAMPREKLKELVGPVSGQKLFTFLRQKVDAT